MIHKEDLDFQVEYHENTTIEDVLRLHENDVCILIHGSGISPDRTGRASFEALLKYRTHTKHIATALNDETANQAAIKGIMLCVDCINVQSRVCVISPVALGFEKAFKSSGMNYAMIQELYRCLLEKECKFTEARCTGMNEQIKRVIRANGNNPYATQRDEEKEKKKNHYKMQYIRKIYGDCINDVINVLQSEGVSANIIAKVQKIEPKEES